MKVKHRAILVVDLEYDNTEMSKDDLKETVPDYVEWQLSRCKDGPFHISNTTFYVNIQDFLTDNREGQPDAVDIQENK